MLPYMVLVLILFVQVLKSLKYELKILQKPWTILWDILT